jgi:Protein of unknown function (DUF1592)/Protein of unknown function (DUF1588)
VAAASPSQTPAPAELALETTLPSSVAQCGAEFGAPNRRLTRFELAYAIEDVFGVDASGLHALPAPLRTIGDVGDIAVGRMLDTSDAFSLPYTREVERMLPALRRAIVARCSRTGEPFGCAFAALREPAVRLLRLSPDTPADPPMVALGHAMRAVESAGLHSVVDAGLKHLLLSPAFYMAEHELGADNRVEHSRRLVATRLALVLWSSVPDVTLLRLAQSGTLETPRGLDEQVARMTRDPKFQRFALELSRQWLRLDRPAQFRPNLADRQLIDDPTLLAQVQQEAASLLRLNFEQRRPVAALIRGERSLLTSRAVLTALSTPIKGGGDENWLGRGVVVQGAFLCRTFPLAAVYPTHLWQQHPLLDPARSAEPRPGEVELLQIRTRDEPCAQCHLQLETIGAALGAFDGLGQLVQHGEAAESAKASAERYGRIAAERMDSAAAVERWVSSSGRFEPCVAQKLSSYVLGRAVLPERRAVDRCLVASLTSSFAGEATLASWLGQLLRSPEFLAPGAHVVRDKPTASPNSNAYRERLLVPNVNPEQCASFEPARYIVDNCGTSACHGAGSSTGVFAFSDAVLVRQSLQASKPNARGYCAQHSSYLDATNPERSLIVEKLLGGEVCGAPMPITGGPRSLGATEHACLVQWLVDAAGSKP